MEEMIKDTSGIPITKANSSPSSWLRSLPNKLRERRELIIKIEIQTMPANKRRNLWIWINLLKITISARYSTRKPKAKQKIREIGREQPK